MQKFCAGLAMLVIMTICAGTVAAQTETVNFQRHELAKWYTLIYDVDFCYVLLLDIEHNPRLISDYCSYPAVAPAKNKFVVLTPWGFEETSDIYMYQADDNYTEAYPIVIHAIPQRDTPKEIAWLDDDILLVVAGFADGTITRGGNLYYFDCMSGRSAKIIDCVNLEIAAISITDDVAHLGMVSSEHYTDNHIIRDYYEETVAVEELCRLIMEQDVLTLTEKPERIAAYPVYTWAGWGYNLVFNTLIKQYENP